MTKDPFNVPSDEENPPTGSILYVIRYTADEQQIVVTGYPADCNSATVINGQQEIARGWHLKSTHGEFAGWIADAIIRHSDAVAGYDDDEDRAFSYDEAIKTLEYARACVR